MSKPTLRQRLSQIYQGSITATNSASVYLGDNKVLTRIYTGQKMYLDTRDISETPHLLMDGHWEIDITSVFERAVEAGGAVFDVGSTYGYYALVAGAKQGQRNNNKIVAVDPNPVFADYLEKNLTVNGLIERSVIAQTAIGAKKGKTTLNILKNDWASTTTQSIEELRAERKQPVELDRSIEVEVMSLDQLAKQHKIDQVSVIKLDIEGMEEVAYPGMSQLIKNSPRLTILLEFSPENYKNPKKFFEQIASDFDFVYAMPGGTDFQSIDNFSQLKKITDNNWVMLVASQRGLDV